jgi:hypothetical protein
MPDYHEGTPTEGMWQHHCRGERTGTDGVCMHYLPWQEGPTVGVSAQVAGIPSGIFMQRDVEGPCEGKNLHHIRPQVQVLLQVQHRAHKPILQLAKLVLEPAQRAAGAPCSSCCGISSAQMGCHSQNVQSSAHTQSRQGSGASRCCVGRGSGQSRIASSAHAR